jgi:hypothetical protein
VNALRSGRSRFLDVLLSHLCVNDYGFTFTRLTAMLWSRDLDIHGIATRDFWVNADCSSVYLGAPVLPCAYVQSTCYVVLSMTSIW